MRIDVITIFPQMFAALTQHGITSRALQRGLFELGLWDPRHYTTDRHRSVDDRPYGGGPGMVMRAPPLARALRAARAQHAGPSKVVYLSPQGKRLDHTAVVGFARGAGLILLAGRYEGVDERLLEACVDEELSIGDYVLSGGELAAMVVIECIVRQLPGALGNEESVRQDSFAHGLLDCVHYTRPERFEGAAVPGVLLGGDHDAIRRWRLRESLGRTWLRRPDLLARLELDEEQRALLESFQRQYGKQEKVS